MFDKSLMPCRVVIEPKEDGDEVIFVFKDEITADKYSASFPFPYFVWICFDGYYNAFLIKRTKIH